MKKMMVTACCIISTAVLLAQTGNSITGRWKSAGDSKSMEMEIYLAADGRYYGKVINDNSPGSKNGHIVINALEYDKRNDTYKGVMTPPDAAVEINVTVTRPDNNKLKVVGKKFLLTKTFYLLRIQ